MPEINNLATQRNSPEDLNAVETTNLAGP